MARLASVRPSNTMRFAILLMAPVLAGAAIWPDTIGPYHRTSTSRPAVSDQALWNEYGLKDSESAKYENGTDAFTATAYRLQDSTGALAAYDWQRPPMAKPST